MWVLWVPDYALEGVIKALTAVVSITTFFVTAKLVPQALQLVGPGELAKVNAELKKNIEERAKAQAELEQAYNLVEQRVKERTTKLRRSEREVRRLNAGLERRVAERTADLDRFPIPFRTTCARRFAPSTDSRASLLKIIETNWMTKASDCSQLCGIMSPVWRT